MLTKASSAGSLWVLVGLLLLPCLSSASNQIMIHETFEALGIGVTAGAAPGYVNDDACGICHKEYFSYQEVAMAKSFYRPSPDKVIEDFENNHYYHAPSRRHYELSLRDGEYWFKRYQLDAHGRPINPFERKVDWILGSGNHVRTYLYQTPLGELYELPLAWYSQEAKWGMQPGYEFAEHLGVLRTVRRECMFCHNAYPDVPEGSDTYLAPQLFPKDLPQGTGCQRCHGPGERHLRALFGGDPDRQEIRSSIVNPGRLEPQRRDDVCFECHMLPAIAATPIRRFGRADYSFRPGQDLAEYLVAYDIRELEQTPEQRFEINHHPYRMQQSRCYRQSEGRLSCLTCHDPHRKVPPAERATHYRSKCLGCHQGLEHPPVTGGDTRDCVTCHMPARRTQDVIEVTMTDHRIGIVPDGEDPTRRIEKRTPIITDILFLEPQRAPAGDLGQIYRVLGILKPNAVAPANAVDYLGRLLARSPPDLSVPYYEFANALQKNKRFEQVLDALKAAEARDGKTVQSLELTAIAHLGLGHNEQALELLQAAIGLDPAWPSAHYNLALVLHAMDRLDEADAHLRKALELRPNIASGWYYLGLVDEARGDPARAHEHYRRALQIDPTHARAYLGMARALETSGHPREALRYLVHGADHAKNPQPVREALDRRANTAAP